MRQDGSLFGCPQTPIIDDDNSYTEKETETKQDQESLVREDNIASISFHK